jgi:predicted  nucleic acid-binding Zn-ribbon protein
MKKFIEGVIQNGKEIPKGKVEDYARKYKNHADEQIAQLNADLVKLKHAREDAEFKIKTVKLNLTDPVNFFGEIIKAEKSLKGFEKQIQDVEDSIQKYKDIIEELS